MTEFVPPDPEHRRADRHRMVEWQIARRGVGDERVLAAMREVPREAFVAPELAGHAYEDSPLPIGAGQTVSQPYIVAYMAEVLELEPRDRVLEVGVGSGYAAAVVSRIASEVWAIERHRELAEAARERLAGLGYGNVHVRHGDGTTGWPEAAPFDAITVAAGGPEVPRALEEQLAAGGRLVIPVGRAREVQSLVRVRRVGETELVREDLGAVRFVPLVGEQGWDGETGAADGAPSPPGGG